MKTLLDFFADNRGVIVESQAEQMEALRGCVEIGLSWRGWRKATDNPLQDVGRIFLVCRGGYLYWGTIGGYMSSPCTLVPWSDVKRNLSCHASLVFTY